MHVNYAEGVWLGSCSSAPSCSYSWAHIMSIEHHRHLSSCTVNNVEEAVVAFEDNEGLMLCQIRPSFSMLPVFSVPEGYYALVQLGGRFADFRGGSPLWPAGLHFRWPSMRVRCSGLYCCCSLWSFCRDHTQVGEATRHAAIAILARARLLV